MRGADIAYKGRAANSQHRHSVDRGEYEGLVPVPRVAMDYFFMTQEDQAANKNPVMGMVDEQTGDKYARAVSNKGLGSNGEMEWLVKDMVNELQTWGYNGGPSGHDILKSDGEPAIKAVRNAVGKLLGGRVVP